MSGPLAGLPALDLALRDTVRLIPSGRLKEPVLAPLAADAAMLDDLAALDALTSGRLRGQQAGLPGLSPRELVFGRPGWSFINAAFLYTRPGGNRFNDEGRGAWYAGLEAETSLAGVAFHLGSELANVRRFENRTDYAGLLADFIGPFADLRGGVGSHLCLHPDPDIGYPAGQALARTLREGGGNGVIYPSISKPGGTCLAAFRPDLVQNVRQGGLWRLEWAGSPEPAISALGTDDAMATLSQPVPVG